MLAIPDLARHVAGWRLHVGTFPGYRYPTLGLDLASGPDLVDAVLSADLAFRATVAGPPDDIGPDTVDQIIDGYEEEFGTYDWDLPANCVPNGPWRVGVLAEDSGDTAEFVGRLVPDQCDLVDAVDGDDTAWLVYTDPYWTRESDDLPCLVRVGGEDVTLTAVASSAVDGFSRVTAAGGWGTAESGQAWTVGGGTAADYSTTTAPFGHGEVAIATLATDYKVVLHVGGADRDVAMELLVDSLPASGQLRTGVIPRYADGSNFVHAEIRVASTGLMELRIVQRLAGSGSTLLTMGMGGRVLEVDTKWTLRVKVAGVTVCARAWPTSGTEPHWWATATTAVLTGDSAGAFCRDDSAVATHVLSYDGLDVREPANWTVTRSVAKSHAALAAVAVANPMVLGL